MLSLAVMKIIVNIFLLTALGAKKPPTLQVFPLLSWDVGQSSPKEGNFQSKFMKMSGAVTHDPNHGKLKY